MSKILTGLNESTYRKYDNNRTGFSRGARDDERHDLDVQQPSKQEWALKINGKVWSKDGKTVTFASKEQALKARQSLLARRPELEVGLVTRGGVAEAGTGLDIDRSIPGRTIARISGTSPDPEIGKLRRNPHAKKLPDFYDDNDYDQWSGKVDPSIDDDEEDTFDTDYTGDEEGELKEISNDALAKYKTAAAADAGKADKEGDYKRGDKRFSGIVKATKKQFANDTKKSSIRQGMAEADDKSTEPFKTGYPRVNNPKILGTQNRAKTAYYPPTKPPVKKLDKPLPENLGDSLKSNALNALLKVKQQIEQTRNDELSQWEQDFKNNVANKFRNNRPQLSPVARPGEKFSVLKSRLSELDKAIEKQKVLDKLVQQAESKGLLNPALQADTDTSLFVRDGAKDNYVALNDKLDNALDIIRSRLSTNKTAFSKSKSIGEDEKVSSRMRMSDYYDLADAIQEKLKQAIQMGDKARIQELNKQRDELDAHVKKHGMMPENVAEEWSQKYKSSINCSHPKGFSQKAHCAGKKKHNESIEMEMVCEDCGMCETHGDHSKDQLDELKCWPGHHRVAGTKAGAPGSCEKNKTNEEQIDEIDRRGFLKGMGAAAVAGAAGGAKSQVGGGEGESQWAAKRAADTWTQYARDNKTVTKWIYDTILRRTAQFYQLGGNRDFQGGTNTALQDAVNAVDQSFQGLYRAIERDKEEGSIAKAWLKGYISPEMSREEQWKIMGSMNRANLAPTAEKFVQVYTDSLNRTLQSVQQPVQPQTSGQSEKAKYTGDNKEESQIPARVIATYVLSSDASNNIPNDVSQAAREELQNFIKVHNAKEWVNSNINYLKKMFLTDYKNNDPEKYKQMVNAYKIHAIKNIDALRKFNTSSADDLVFKESVNQGVAEEQHSCPHCGGEMVSEELMNEKKDACYYKVKSRYKVWPSAYASGALVKCRNKGAKNWGNGGKKNESSILEGLERADESLHDWFNKEKWVRMDTKGKIKGPCAREPGEGKPKCLPQSKAHSLGKKGRASAAQRKRREDPNPERSGKAINVDTKKSKG